jgi:hypothetical protein
VLASSEASASTSWVIQATPNGQVTNGNLSSASCSSASVCTAVGYYRDNSGADRTLAERWDGISWVVQATPNPTGATRGRLNGVSCTAVGVCTAVGFYSNSSGDDLTLAERWDGSSWVIQATPNPTGATLSRLNGVSCTSASACTAVGPAGNGLTLAERWSGTSWVIQATPNPGGATISELNGVSCASAIACAAVGDYVVSPGTQRTLGELWNGTSWVIKATPNPAGSNTTVLNGVSCTAASACTAVGFYFNSSSTAGLTLAERWNGTSWVTQATANPAGSTLSILNGVSCTSATACNAVGQGKGLTLDERWNGTSWVIEATPNPSSAKSSSLGGVSCTAASACTAVGLYTDSSSTDLTLADRWNGTSWAIQSNATSDSLLSIVSCTAASACTAVGWYTNEYGTQVTLAERWNGSSWTIQPTPNPSGARGSFMSGVTCTAANSCVAVGTYLTSGPQVTLAERWNGTSWAIQSTPNPTGAVGSALSTVSCAVAGACTAVGSYVKSGARLTLAERWNGTSWAIQSTPNPTGATFNSIGGVSCTAASACTASGTYTNSSGTQMTLAERWNGSSWAIQATPNPSGAKSSSLGGVSCTAASACTASGTYTNSSGTQLTLAESWNGTTWAIQATPSPTGGTGSVLDSVSCTASSTCTAVGFYTNSSGARLTLAEGES